MRHQRLGQRIPAFPPGFGRTECLSVYRSPVVRSSALFAAKTCSGLHPVRRGWMGLKHGLVTNVVMKRLHDPRGPSHRQALETLCHQNEQLGEIQIVFCYTPDPHVGISRMQGRRRPGISSCSRGICRRACCAWRIDRAVLERWGAFRL